MASGELLLEIETAGGQFLQDRSPVRLWHQRQRANLEIVAAGRCRRKSG